MTATLVPLSEVARRYGFKANSLSKLAKKGGVPGARKIGSRYRVHLPTLAASDWGPPPPGTQERTK